MKYRAQRPYNWIQTIITHSTRNSVGEFLLTSATAKIEDAADLVESVKVQSSDEIVWMTFCKLIDRIVFFALSVLYFFMFITLLPEGYLSIKYDPIETVSWELQTFYQKYYSIEMNVL